MNGVLWFGEPIVRELRLARGLDESRPSEVCQVPRDRRLGQSQDIYEIAHAELAGRQQTEDPDSRRISEPAEYVVQVVDSCGRRRRRHPDSVSCFLTFHIRLSECNVDRRT